MHYPGLFLPLLCCPWGPGGYYPGLILPCSPQAPEVAVSGKRQGPLPLWVAEFAVLGLYAALAASVTKYSKESAAALEAVGKLVKDLAKKANLV